jgi:hypothetical protein
MHAPNAGSTSNEALRSTTTMAEVLRRLQLETMYLQSYLPTINKVLSIHRPQTCSNQRFSICVGWVSRQSVPVRTRYQTATEMNHGMGFQWFYLCQKSLQFQVVSLVAGVNATMSTAHGTLRIRLELLLSKRWEQRRGRGS